MTVMAKRALVLAAATIASCVSAHAIDPLPSPPLPAGYNLKKPIAEWMKRSFAEPSAIRSVAISELVPIDIPQSKATWLVCVELDARAKGGDYMGPKRFALGFRVVEPTNEQKEAAAKADPPKKPPPPTVEFIAPIENERVPQHECYQRPLLFTPWQEWARSAEPVGTKRSERQKRT